MPDKRENYFRYIPVRQRDVQWGLYVTGAGCASTPPAEPYPPDTHPELYHFRWETGRTLPEYQVIYVTHGEGYFESAPTGGRNVEPGTVLLLFPGVWHRYRPRPETGWQEYWVGFNGEGMDRLVERKFFSPENAVLATGLQDDILAPYQSLLERLRGEMTGFPHLIAADTWEILAAVSAAAEREPAELIAHGPQDVVTLKDRVVAEAMRLIWEQSQSPMTIDGLARQLSITRRSLERRFRAAVGHGIHEEIVRCRLERAKRQLAQTELSLKEIARAAGFPSCDNLGRAFRRAEGVSPLEFRRRSGRAKRLRGTSARSSRALRG
jgi:AraC-like DNA-binding protein